MSNVNIEVFNIARTQVDREAVRRWLDHIGADGYEIPEDGGVSDPALLIALAAKRCFDDKTDILTSRGWVRFENLTEDDVVATYNIKSAGMEFQKPLAIVKYPYNGPMKCVEARDISFCVTPDHRQYCYVSSLKHAGWKFWTTESVSDVRFKVMTSCGGWSGATPEVILLEDHDYTQVSSNQFGTYGVMDRRSPGRSFMGRQVPLLAELLTYYAAEGSVDDGVIIYGDHLARISEICEELDLSCTFTTDPRNGVKKISIGGGIPLRDYFVRNCGHGSENKKLPRWVLDLPSDVLQIIWDTLVITDGTITESGHKSLLTTSTLLIDCAQEILAKLGRSSAIAEAQGTNLPCFRIPEKSGRDAWINNSDGTQMFESEYSGYVHCVSTINGIVLVRRNGKYHFSGNCYMSFQPLLNPNVSKVRTDMVEYIDNILASGHGSVLEHSVYTFAIEGVSRVFTGELNRHRAGWAISEGSMRFIRFEKDIPWWMPTSLIPQEGDDADLVSRKERSQHVFKRAFEEQMRDNYCELLRIWDMDAAHHNFTYKKKVTSCLRRIIGMGVATGGVWSGNIRALRHVLTMRAAEAAEEEIFHVFADLIAPVMLAGEPMLFGDFKQSSTGAWGPGYRKV